MRLDASVIAKNCARIKDRLAQDMGPPHEDPVAIVCYGPSLKVTFPEIAKYKTIFTCSGAHKFLLDRGIVPTYHVETDPQKHKAAMLGKPHRDTTYLIASNCHSNYFDWLEQNECKVKLFNLLFTDIDTYKHLPSGEWLMTGGNTVGVRTMKVAYILKHYNQHIFGLDMSGRHAGEHLNPPKEDSYEDFEYGGKTYKVTKHNKMQFMGLFTELACYMPDLKYTFFGEGLVQAAAAHVRIEPADPAWPMLIQKERIRGVTR